MRLRAIHTQPPTCSASNGLNTMSPFRRIRVQRCRPRFSHHLESAFPEKDKGNDIKRSRSPCRLFPYPREILFPFGVRGKKGSSRLSEPKIPLSSFIFDGSFCLISVRRSAFLSLLRSGTIRGGERRVERRAHAKGALRSLLARPRRSAESDFREAAALFPHSQRSGRAEARRGGLGSACSQRWTTSRRLPHPSTDGGSKKARGGPTANKERKGPLFQMDSMRSLFIN